MLTTCNKHNAQQQADNNILTICISVIMRLSNALLLFTLPVRTTYHEQTLACLGLDFVLIFQ
jgi:hypothetical protein